jgi:hypothetical protein
MHCLLERLYAGQKLEWKTWENRVAFDLKECVQLTKIVICVIIISSVTSRNHAILGLFSSGTFQPKRSACHEHSNY